MTDPAVSSSLGGLVPAARWVDAEAWFPGYRARRVVECVDVQDAAARVEAGGFWAVVGEFGGPVRAWRFADVERGVVPTAGPPRAATPWRGPDPATWSTSLDRDGYVARVREVRERIRAGDVYQVNLCRVLEAPLATAGGPGGAEPDAAALGALLLARNPAPYAGGVHVPAASGLPPVWVVSASPELFLRVDGGLVTSGPIKGTAPEPSGLSEKDRAENVMITDLVRNDLQQICEPGTVEVVDLLAVEQHPGLVHLVTTVQGRLRSPVPDWSAVLRATFPPGSVSGAPKRAALALIDELETAPRGPYTGAVGWIDSDAGRAELAVGIRTFWWSSADGGRLRFGTGAGITWGSDPEQEWAETELKAHRLVGLASASA